MSNRQTNVYKSSLSTVFENNFDIRIMGISNVQYDYKYKVEPFGGFVTEYLQLKSFNNKLGMLSCTKALTFNN